MNLTNGPIIGFLHPSEMTPEERMNELAAIFAAEFLSTRKGLTRSESQAQSSEGVDNKPENTPLTYLEENANTRLCGSQTESIL